VNKRLESLRGPSHTVGRWYLRMMIHRRHRVCGNSGRATAPRMVHGVKRVLVRSAATSRTLCRQRPVTDVGRGRERHRLVPASRSPRFRGRYRRQRGARRGDASGTLRRPGAVHPSRTAGVDVDATAAPSLDRGTRLRMASRPFQRRGTPWGAQATSIGHPTARRISSQATRFSRAVIPGERSC
jgi:hypothetical protein